MSGSVDDEIVRMRFDNSAFERGVATTLTTLQKLKSSLSFQGADKGLDQIEAKANRFNLSGMSSGIDGLSKKFLGLSAVGITAISNITNRAVNAGITLARSFTLDPIKAGFTNYETQINAVQTILANTGLTGAAGLAQVNKALGDLNTYANKTVYNFSQMAASIGTFTAAGVKLGPATSAIKGIANLAAASGSSADQASGAMYQLSQALAAGTFKLQDYNSVVNAGIGGKLFQTAIFNAATAAKTLKGVKVGETYDQWTKAGNNFRQSLNKGYVTTKVLTNALASFTGDETAQQLKAQGYTAAQILQTQQTARLAVDAATKIKTFTQLTSALKEEVATAYGAVFKTIFGDINGATALFSQLHTVIENALTNPIYKFNALLEQVSALGGRARLIQALTNVFKAFGAILKPIKEAFREIFPAKTAKDIVGLITKFDVFTGKLKIGATTAAELKRVFAGVFAAFDIGKQIVLGIFKVFTQLFGTIGKSSGGFLAFIANIGDMVVAFDKALKAGDYINNLFRIFANVLKIPIQLFGFLGDAITDLFAGFNFKKANGVFDSITNGGGALEAAAAATQRFSNWFSGLAKYIKPGVDAVVSGFKKIGQVIAQSLNSQAFNNILQALQTGLIGGILLTLKKFLSGGLGGFHVDVGKGIFGQAKEALEGVTGSLKAMQTELKAKALLEIAIAMAVLAVSVVALANTDPKRLQAGLTAMAVGFGQLLTAMAILVKISGSAGFVKIPALALALDLLAGAILILAAAVEILGHMSWAELEKGLGAVAILLISLSAASLILSKNSAGMVRAGIGITAMAIGINLLAVAVEIFAHLSYDQIQKGLIGVAGTLASVAIAMRAMPENLVLRSVGIAILAVALQGLYLAVKDFANFSYAEMRKGLLGVAASLLAIAAAMQVMPADMLLQSVALIAVGYALGLISQAVTSMSKLSYSEIGRGLTALGGALAILAAGLFLMTNSLAGAAALLVVAYALRIFVPVLLTLASTPWGTLLKGLGMLALSFAVIGVAGLALTPVIPALLGLGAALALIGVGMLAFGAGAVLLGIGLTAIAAGGGAAIAVLVSGLTSIISLLPTLGQNLALGLVNFVTIIGKNAPAIIGAFVTLLNSLLNAVPKIMPALVTAIGSLIQAILKVIITNAPSIIQAGLTLLEDLLSGIANNIGKVVTTVVDIIVNFLNTLTNNLPRIINAGVNLLFAFLEGVTRASAKMPAEVIKLVGIFISTLADSFPSIVSNGISMVSHLISGIAGGYGKMLSAGYTLVKNVVSGIAKGFGDLASSGVTIAGKVITAVKDAAQSAYETALSIGSSIVQGILNGIGDLASKVGSKIKSGVSAALSTVGGFLGIGGPSMLFSDEVGTPIGLGIAHGIDKSTSLVTDSLNSVGKNSIIAMKKTMAGLGDAIANSDFNYNPTITPVLDLTEVSKSASQIGSLVTPPPIKATVSYVQASDIAASRNTQTSDADVTSTPALGGTSVVLNQYNTSPKALSTTDIYRQTNNALSKTKKALGVPSA